MNIAIIPARGGSKRIPRKNIKLFGGKPMIAYAIEAAAAASLFERIVVSTDDAEIASIAREYGAETPFLRPPELANDYAATVPVIAHAIESCRSLGIFAEQVCCIYPGVPFMLAQDLSGALKLLQESNADYCFPVTEFPSAVQRALGRADNGGMTPLYPQYELTRTQDLPLAYHDAGQFYWGGCNAWLSNPRIHSSSVGYVIPNWRVVDIDTPEDWMRAEKMRNVLGEI
ncbi:pseudaminic acid cytidylyltransferase [Herbaspirillum sp. NPDC101397]|uniref:pseudaminic acid cytidylyltransferase n=1 Tax=Herbaspirillum sp. NPDC101397 TaxID=3364006 RepID=UPI00383B3BA0